MRAPSLRGSAVSAVVLGVFIVGAGTVTSTTGQDVKPTSSPEPTAQGNSTSELEGEGPGLSHVADRLQSLGGSHFAGLVIDEDKSHIVSYWKGDIPAAVRDFADTQPAGVTIELVKGAEFS